MIRKTYHVTPAGKKWRVKRAGAARADGLYESKTSAIIRAKVLATRGALGQVRVHRGDGEIHAEYTYGKDPRRSPG